MAEEYLFWGRPRKITKTLGRPRRSQRQTQSIYLWVERPKNGLRYWKICLRSLWGMLY